MFIPIELDKPRKLRFDLPACLAMEAMLGLPFGDIVHRLRSISLTTIRGALWAGLKHEDESLTLTSVGDIMGAFLDGGGKLNTITSALDKAISNSTPLQSSDAGNGKPKAK